MDQIQLQQKYIYDSLDPLFREEGYALLPYQKQFRMPTRNGYRAALITVGGNPHEPTIDLNLAIRLDVVEELANQFLSGLINTCKDGSTLIVSYGRIMHQPVRRFLVKDEEGIDAACRGIEGFMRQKGFQFLEKFDHLRKIDALMNRRPDQPCHYMPNQLSRCFKGLVTARLTHRTNFNRLVKTYYSYLQKPWTDPAILANYKKMVRFLRFFSIN